MKDDTKATAERFGIAEQAVPERMERAAIAIVRTGSSSFGHGSGTLFQVADCHFVVTAKHVIRDALSNDWSLGITGEHHIIETPGNWAGSPEGKFQPDRGLGDIAVYKLSNEQVSSLGSKEFVRLADLGLRVDLSRGFFRLLGFPVIWADGATTEVEPLRLGPFRYSTTAAKDTGRLGDYDAEVHFLLNAHDSTLVNQHGEETSLRARTGHRVNLVRGVAGISGSGVWRIGQPGLSPEYWRQEDAKVVGVVTGVYDDAQVIKATKWVFVTKLIYELFPEVRRVLHIYAP